MCKISGYDDCNNDIMKQLQCNKNDISEGDIMNINFI